MIKIHHETVNFVHASARTCRIPNLIDFELFYFRHNAPGSMFTHLVLETTFKLGFFKVFIGIVNLPAYIQNC